MSRPVITITGLLKKSFILIYSEFSESKDNQKGLTFCCNNLKRFNTIFKNEVVGEKISRILCQLCLRDPKMS